MTGILRNFHRSAERIPMDTNTVIITGRLTRDPDFRSTATGAAVVDFTIASGDGDRTYFGAVTAWNGPANFIRQNCRKGSWVLVLGKLSREEWRDRNGDRQAKTRIVAVSVELLRPAAGDVPQVQDRGHQENLWNE